MTASAGHPAAPLDRTHDPGLECWVDSANGHPDFPVQNLPLGVFEPVGVAGRHGSGPRGGIRIGDEILDLRALSGSGLLSGAARAAASAAAAGALNDLFGMGAVPRNALRQQVSALLTSDAAGRGAVAELLCPVGAATMSLPATVGDYTDFYAGIHHATRVGSLFRPDNPLLPNYKWVPIGYHGRASTVRPSGGAVHRPNGQLKDPDQPVPTYLPTRKLDFELELGIWIGPDSRQGQPIPIGRAAEHVAGYCLLNDWSARDVQAWEYQPLGPFLSKSFATTVSAWVVTPEALAPFRLPLPDRPAGDPEPLPYLRDERDRRSRRAGRHARGAAVDADHAGQGLSSTAARRQLHPAPLLERGPAHRAPHERRLRPAGRRPARQRHPVGARAGWARQPAGDDGWGRHADRAAHRRDPHLPADGDEVILRARAERPGAAPIGFGECRAVVQPAPAAGTH